MIALYTGSFDPVTRGHMDIISRAANLFDSLVVGVFHNPQKQSGAFAIDERIALLRMATADIQNVTVDAFSGLAVDGARAVGAEVIVRGIRAGSDVDMELQMARLNMDIAGVETLLLPSTPKTVHISASMVRQIAAHGGDISRLVPACVLDAIAKRLSK